MRFPDSKMRFGVWNWHTTNELAKDKNEVKYLLGRQNLFIRSVDAKNRKQKSPKIRGFSSRITKPWIQENLGRQGTELTAEFEKLCEADGIQIYSTMSETKAAVAERTIQSLKSILFCYMEHY